MHWRYVWSEKEKKKLSERKYTQAEPWQHTEPYFEYYFAAEKPLMLQTIGYCVRKERHNLINRCVDKYVFHYVLNGTGFFNGHPFEAGDILYCSRNTPYSLSPNTNEGCIYAYFSFSGGKSNRYVELLNLHTPFAIYKNKNLDKIAEVFYDLIECPHEEVEKDIYMEAAFLRILSYSKFEGPEPSLPKTPNYSTRVEKAIKYITDHYREADLRVSTVALALQTNERYLCDHFKKEVGTTMYQYITNLRMEVAVTLLTSSHYNVNEISEYVGYNDHRNFIEIFKKKYGVTPAKFKKSPQNDL